MRTSPFIAVMLLISAPVQAHNRSVSYSTWELGPHSLQVQLRLPASVLNSAGLLPDHPETAPTLAAELQAGFIARAGHSKCESQPGSVRRAGSVYILDGAWTCTAAPTRLESRFLLARIPGHLHLLQVRTPAGTLLGPYALSAAQPQLALAAGAPAQKPEFARYLGLGAQHILAGWDHLAFLVIVVLGAATLAQLAWRVTGFTLGHSLTLALATLGALRPPAVMVEAFIALTIAGAAAERLLAQHPRAVAHGTALTAALCAIGCASGVLPWMLLPATALLCLGAHADARLDGLRTALFGLFHGFGFAGVLGELSAAQAVPPLPLFGFNLGVELGQLLFVLPLWWLARRWPALSRPAVPAAVLALGSAAFLARLT